MRVAVAGGNGRVGREVVLALNERGHESVIISRSAGVDLLTGAGLGVALDGTTAVIDVTNTPALDPTEVKAFFGTATTNLVTAEREAGVQHHVLLSILGLDRVTGNGHYAGKRLQEQIVRDAGITATIVRAAQFFDFAEMVASWTRRDGKALIPPMLVQPLDVRDLAQMLAAVATGTPSSETIEVAGPEPQDLVDMARRTLAARGEHVQLVPSWRGPFGHEMGGEALLPGPEAHTLKTTFDSWLSDLANVRAQPVGLGLSASRGQAQSRL